ncbi:AraC family transcriptional regulator [Cytobacillus sp. FJAT-54145]|uniref:AraC family transcriptional regulator n=1 Tax=Cytobacillus spartinae TaxID=3299023 RepID=A0ABW6KAZ5_9BACI
MFESQCVPFENGKISVLKIREGEVDEINSKQFNHLIYIASGRGQLLREGKQIPIVEGKGFWVSGENVIISNSPNLLTVYCLQIKGLPSVPLADQSPAKAVSLWEEAINLQKGQSFSERCRYQAAVWNLLSFMTDQTEVDRIEETMEMIKNHLSTPFSVTELAGKAGMSPTYFSRTFKKRVGMTPKEFLIVERIKVAKKLMVQNKGVTTKDVAIQVGLQDEFYFSRLFKKKEGVAPSIFMKRSKERFAVVSQMFLQDHFLSLGIRPVVAPAYPTVFPSSNGVPSYLEKKLEGTLLLNAEKTFLPEEILQVQADWIIKTPLHNGQLQSILLSHQQKVVQIPFKAGWNEYLREIALLIGEEGKVVAIEKEIDSLENKVKNDLSPMLKKGSWAVIWIRQNEIRLYGRKNHAFFDLFYQILGFEPHPELPEEGYQKISLEQLASLNSDKLLILWSQETDVWRVAQNKEWQNIRAVANGEVYYPKSYDWDPWGPLGRKNMLHNFSTSLESSKLVY